MTTRETLIIALEALKKTTKAWGGTCAWYVDVNQAIAAINETLSDREPVAWMKVEYYIDSENLWSEHVTFNQNEDGKPLYE